MVCHALMAEERKRGERASFVGLLSVDIFFVVVFAFSSFLCQNDPRFTVTSLLHLLTTHNKSESLRYMNVIFEKKIIRHLSPVGFSVRLAKMRARPNCNCFFSLIAM